MKGLIRFVYLVFLFAGCTLVAQNNTNKEVQVFSQYSAKDARKIYVEVVKKGFASADLFKKIADSYYFEEDYSNAVSWYEKLSTGYPSQMEHTSSLRYAQSLRAIDKDTLADKVLASLETLNPIDAGGSGTTTSSNDPSHTQSQYILEDIGLVNSKHTDFAPNFYQGNLIFASDGQRNRRSNKNKKKGKQPATRLYQSKKDGNLGYYTSPVPFGDKLTSKHDESTATFSKDGNTIYFTRKQNGKAKIYTAIKKKGEWSKPSEVPFNSSKYATEHPTLKKDNTILYFASDRPGSLGSSDIWYVEIKADGGYSTPVNAGASVNTAARETYPFISENGSLYFASEGHPGLGGLDIFVISEADLQNTQASITHLGAPINSPSDDFSFVLKDTEGFFVSNRDVGQGGDDIYKFKQSDACAILTTGIIRGMGSNQPISGATVTLIDTYNKVVESVVSDASGIYTFTETRCNTRYITRGAHSQYRSNEIFFITQDGRENLNQTLYLEDNLKSLKVGDDLTRVLDLNPISFDVDRFNIQDNAALELEKVIAFMNANPSLKIDVRSHTDSRSRDSYNQLLSNKRNAATIAYLIDHGIHKKRLSGKGYGESQPLNRCSNGVECSEEEHERNRRSEFIVVQF